MKPNKIAVYATSVVLVAIAIISILITNDTLLETKNNDVASEHIDDAVKHCLETKGKMLIIPEMGNATHYFDYESCEWNKETRDPRTLKGEQIKAFVDLAIMAYDNKGLDWLSKNLTVKDRDGQKYIFVVDLETQQILAHPNSDFVGKDIQDVYTDEPWDDAFLSKSVTEGSNMWTTLSFKNPEIANTERMTFFLKTHNGLVFASGTIPEL